MKRRKLISRAALNLIFVVGSLVCLIPFALALVNSLKTAPEAQRLQLSLPAEYHFENFQTVVVEANLVRAAVNGLLYGVSSVAVTILLCSVAAYVIARRSDRWAKGMNTYLTLGIILPMALIPTFVILKVMGLLGTYPGLILVYISGSISMSVFLYRGFIADIPRELDEAAFVDGAGTMRTFYQIIFPTLKPITATVAVLTFMNVWNDFSTQLYFGTQEMRGMPLSVYNFFGKYSQSWNLVFADVILTMIPVVVVYIFAQKYIISGMTSGAVKG